MTVGSQAPLLYTFDAIPSMPYDEADPPHLPVPWLNIYDTRDFLSFLAEPLFRRSDGLASVVDLRVRSGRDFPKSHSAYWELPAGLGRDRDGLHVAADRAADRARGTAARVRGAQGAGVGGGVRERPPAAIRPAAADPQRWKLAAAVSSMATTAPRVMAASAIRARGNLWTSTVHLLFGSPATCVRPVALRPRLATGLPLSVGRAREGVDRRQQPTAVGRRGRERPKWRAGAYLRRSAGCPGGPPRYHSADQGGPHSRLLRRPEATRAFLRDVLGWPAVAEPRRRRRG